MDAAALAARIDLELRGVGDSTRAETEKRYLKSSLHHYGTTVPTIRRIAKAALADRTELERGTSFSWSTISGHAPYTRRAWQRSSFSSFGWTSSKRPISSFSSA